MIAANELRIGNFVNYYNDDTLFTVIGIDDLGIRVKNEEQQTWIEYDCFSHLPINEEWLIKLGFENMEKFPLKYVQRIKPDSLSEFEPCIVVGDLWLTGIRYVHQLQNLYFALTQTELKICQ